ncbi:MULTISPECIES: hypothetical protein [unclassified Isoptericola]|uniref:hypothetical protein n=1 Tax=Isoptericola sp. NPDC057191 TaxID=3346041 RepID=UPI003633ECCD
MKPATNRTGSARFTVMVADRFYTRYFVCHGDGEIRVWDKGQDEATGEPEVWPCNGVPVESVVHFDAPGKRVISVKTTKQTASDWSLVAVAGLPDGLTLTED